MSIHQLSRTRLVVHFLNDCVHGIKQHSLNDYVIIIGLYAMPPQQVAYDC